jgi:hypothetical protein
MDPAALRTPGMTAIRAITALTSNGAKTAATASGVGTGITTTTDTTATTITITITITAAASAMAGVRMAGAEARSIQARWG